MGLRKFWVRRGVDYRVRNKRLLSWRANFEALLKGVGGGHNRYPCPTPDSSHCFNDWVMGHPTLSFLIVLPMSKHAIDCSFLPFQVPGQLSQFLSHIRQQNRQLEAETLLIKRHLRRGSFTGRWQQDRHKSPILWNTRFSPYWILIHSFFIKTGVNTSQ